MNVQRSTIVTLSLLLVILALPFAGLATTVARGSSPHAAATSPMSASDVAPASDEEIRQLVAQAETDATAPRFDAAEDATRFVWSERPVHEDGMPAHGNAFVTQGYIYPYGTLDGGNGVLSDGSPEFPDLVIGEWTCRGWFVGEGAHTESGPWVITTQLFNFGNQPGDATIVTEGYEIADVGVAIERAITGGTGRYSGASGEGAQVLLGFNASEGVNLRFELTIAGS